LVLTIGPYFYIKIRLQKLRKNNIKLEQLITERSAEIMAQKDELEVQHGLMKYQQNEILDSIQYARRIQSAVLVPFKNIMTVSKEFFIFFKPKDIVSGDFYWSTILNNKLIVAIGDCTGHGVPGAFMSMLGISFLKQIVNEKKIHTPGKILDLLRDMTISSLQQSDEDNELYDGMDMTLCSYDLKTEILEFAGANNSLYLIRENEITKISGDRMPISSYPTMDPFTNKLVDARKGDCLYMFSDGYIDQFGGPRGKKYKIKLFSEFLLEIHKKPMKEQKELLDQNLKDWISFKDKNGETFEQVDDIVVLVVKL